MGVRTNDDPDAVGRPSPGPSSADGDGRGAGSEGRAGGAGSARRSGRTGVNGAAATGGGPASNGRGARATANGSASRAGGGSGRAAEGSGRGPAGGTATGSGTAGHGSTGSTDPAGSLGSVNGSRPGPGDGSAGGSGGSAGTGGPAGGPDSGDAAPADDGTGTAGESADAGPGTGGGPVRSTSRRPPSMTTDTARPEGGGRAAPGDAPAPARQWPLLTVVALVGLGLVIVGADPFADAFRVGTLVIGAALIVAAVLRRILPSVGMLAVRSRFTDMVTYGLLGAAITLLALMAQPEPWLEVPFLERVVEFAIRGKE
ncbi:DUF3017 domain-containing protein [Streptomyces sp. NPDC004609]|uniref:DUF3017 domain-containing protein n=1 Tax=Streptomyces sp. NPDC004609 TaxID=3364704 RepID=UPI003678B757